MIMTFYLFIDIVDIAVVVITVVVVIIITIIMDGWIGGDRIAREIEWLYIDQDKKKQKRK